MTTPRQALSQHFISFLKIQIFKHLKLFAARHAKVKQVV